MMRTAWKEYGTNWGKLWSSWGPLCQIFIAFFFLGSLLNLLNIVSVLCFGIFGHKACVILVPWLGIEPSPSALEGEDLTTELPGKSPDFYCCWADSVVSCFH